MQTTTEKIATIKENGYDIDFSIEKLRITKNSLNFRNCYTIYSFILFVAFGLIVVFVGFSAISENIES